MAVDFLIVPGLNGSADGHWQQWWLRDHPAALLVQQANWAVPDADTWLANLVGAVSSHPHAVLVGHSLGSVLIARLASHPIAAMVRGALLVAPADIERTQAVHRRSFDFGSMPEHPLPFPSLVVASRDDIYMSLQRASQLAGAWGSGLVDLGYAGHINIASGYGRWQEGYRLSRMLEPAGAMQAAAIR